MTATGIMGRSTGFTTGDLQTPADRARRVWEYRNILRLVVARDMKVRYAGSALGYLWTVLEPLAMSAVYWFVFTQILNRHIGFPPFILFLVSGQLPWYWMSGSITGALNALRGESQMVRSTSVPRELWVLRIILSRGMEYVFSLPVLAIIALYYLKPPTWNIIWTPVAIVMSFALLMGLGMIVAPLAVLVPDMRSIIKVGMRVLYFMSPILYSVTDVVEKRGGTVAAISSWNPIAGIMVLFRSVFFPQEMNWTYVWHAAIECVIIFAIGLYVFNRLEAAMLKEI